MKRFFVIWIISVMSLSGCVSDYVFQNDQRYATPGAMDSPIKGLYDTYQTHFLGQYRITFQWFESDCFLRAEESPRLPDGRRSHFYVAPDIYEKDGKTWQASPVVGYEPMDFDRFARSVISERLEYEDDNGKMHVNEPRENGYYPLAFMYWEKSSSYMRLLFQKRDLTAFKKIFNEKYPEGRWSQKRLGKNVWTVQSVEETGLREPAVNGALGGPYQNWFLPIGNTDYTIVLELGVNQIALEYPEDFAALKEVFKHLLESVEIEPM